VRPQGRRRVTWCHLGINFLGSSRRLENILPP